MNTHQTLLDGTVAAQDAPLGVCLWPVRSPEYAANFTLDNVAVVRDTNGTHVVWAYQNGKVRHFQLGEQVMVRVDPNCWPTAEILAFTADAPLAISTHPADGVATRPTSTIRPSHILGHNG